jgi:hypothetical protein
MEIEGKTVKLEFIRHLAEKIIYIINSNDNFYFRGGME